MGEGYGPQVDALVVTRISSLLPSDGDGCTFACDVDALNQT